MHIIILCPRAIAIDYSLPMIDQANIHDCILYHMLLESDSIYLYAGLRAPWLRFNYAVHYHLYQFQIGYIS